MIELSCRQVVEAALGEAVRRSGGELLYRCPQHDDNDPSLSVNPRKNAWMCGPCGKGGENGWSLAAFLIGSDPSTDKENVLGWLKDKGLVEPKPQSREVAAYDYKDEDGKLLFQCVRMEPKTFRQRQPGTNGEQWVWNLKGVRLVPYRLPEWMKQSTVYVVEGEKDADNLWAWSLPATTNPMGAGKWRDGYNSFFTGKRVVILPDNDEPGNLHAITVAEALLPVASAVKIVRLPGLPPKGDVSDWIAKGGTKEALAAAVKGTATYEQRPDTPDPLILAERALLSVVLKDNTTLPTAASAVRPEDFSADAHRRIFAAMTALAESNKPIDTVTLTQQLQTTGQLEAVGGQAYLRRIATTDSRTENVEAYAASIKGASTLRRLASSADAISKEALAAAESPAQIVQRAEERILAISDEQVARQGVMTLYQVYQQSYGGSPDALFSRNARARGLPTGFRRIDALTSGLQPSDFIIIAARPSMGKTAWMLNACRNVADSGKLALIFSLEMSKEAIFERLLCQDSRVDSQRYRAGTLNRDEANAVLDSIAKLTAPEYPLLLDDTAGIDLMEMRAKARRVQIDRGLALCAVDYLQLMTAPRAENRVQEVSALSRGMKAMAKDLSVPLLVLSQLSRAGERDGDKRPLLSHLRDSGSLEQDADLVAFIYREEYYYKMQGREVPVEAQGRAEFIVAKQRNGPTGSIPILFIERYSSFAQPAEYASTDDAAPVQPTTPPPAPKPIRDVTGERKDEADLF